MSSAPSSIGIKICRDGRSCQLKSEMNSLRPLAVEEVDEEGGAGGGRDDPDRELGRGEERPGGQVAEDEEDPARQRRIPEQGILDRKTGIRDTDGLHDRRREISVHA